MTTPRPRTQRQRVEESSRRLAEAAIDLIAQQGYSKTTARDIGLRAGYSRAMVAERFGSKEALLDAVLENFYERRIDVESSAEASGLQRVLLPIDALSQFAVDDPRMLKALFVINFEAIHTTDVLRGRISGWITRMHQRFNDAVAAGQVDGSIREDVSPGDVSADIIATGIGHAYLWILAPDQNNLVAALKRWRECLADSLRDQSS